MISSKTRRKVEAARLLYATRANDRTPPEARGSQHYTGYFKAAVGEIPESVIRRISAVDLCDLAEAIELGWKHSRELERKEALSEGAIWDGQKMREIR